ncbi:MAG: type 4a pilus biogenesis protein PilO [Clostridia bacterium]|nr:type 4a pilus biogenesis protein PilO [Clostridia bacterium]
MPRYVKWEVAKKSQNEYNIGNKKFSFGKQGISTVDIIIIVIASIAIISSGFFLYRNIAALNSVTDEIDAMKVTIQSKQDTISKLAELGNNEQELRDQYAQNELYIPAKKNSESIMKDIDDILINEKVTFISLQYSPEIALNDGIMDVPFVLKIQATYNKVNRVLEAFSKTQRLYVIDSVNSTSTNTNDEIISSEIVIHAYYKPN